MLRGSVESPKLGLKIQKLRSAAKEQQSRLSLIDQDIQEIREERDSLRDIVSNLPQSCPQARGEGKAWRWRVDKTAEDQKCLGGCFNKRNYCLFSFLVNFKNSLTVSHSSFYLPFCPELQFILQSHTVQPKTSELSSVSGDLYLILLLHLHVFLSDFHHFIVPRSLRVYPNFKITSRSELLESTGHI